MKIGTHEVTNVTFSSAYVGCTKVTKKQVEELLAKMNKAPNEIIPGFSALEPEDILNGIELAREAGANHDFMQIINITDYRGKGFFIGYDSDKIKWKMVKKQSCHFLVPENQPEL